MVFAAQAQVFHIHDTNLGEYAQRKYTQGFWKALLTRWHPQRMCMTAIRRRCSSFRSCFARRGCCSRRRARAVFWPSLHWVWAGFLVVTLFLWKRLPFLLKLGGGRGHWR